MKYLPKEPDEELTRVSFRLGVVCTLSWLGMLPKIQTNLAVEILTGILICIMCISILVLILKWIYRFSGYVGDF